MSSPAFGPRSRLPNTDSSGFIRALPLAHPLDDGSAVTLDRSIESTAARLGPDGPAYRTHLAPLAQRWPELAREMFARRRIFPRIPSCSADLDGCAWQPLRRRRALRCFAPSEPVHYSPVWPPIRSFRWRRPDRPPFGWMLALAGTRGGLAHPPRRIATHRERAGFLLPIARRRNYHQHASPVAPRSGRRRAHLVATSRRASCSRSPAPACPRVSSASCARTATAPEYSKSIGRSSAPHSLESRRVFARRNGSHRRNAGGDRGLGTSRGKGNHTHGRSSC